MKPVVFVLAAAIGCGRIGFDASPADNLDAELVRSCYELPTTCGPSAKSSCCGSTLVPGGTFSRRYDVGTDHAFDQDASAIATVGDFRLDTYEVTVGRFRQFVLAGLGTQGHPPAAGTGARMLGGVPSQGGWDMAWNANLASDTQSLVAGLACDPNDQSWADAPSANEDLPINCVTWFEAFAFCTWDGGFLPTEAEWNYAAAAGSQQRAYPWSTPPSSVAIDCAHANYFDGTTTCTGGVSPRVNRVGSESPAGDGLWGQADLGGNVWEWVLDGVGPFETPCTDCAALGDTSSRGQRGGDYGRPALYSRTAIHQLGFDSDPPAGRKTYAGVRCARSP